MLLVNPGDIVAKSCAEGEHLVEKHILDRRLHAGAELELLVLWAPIGLLEDLVYHDFIDCRR